MHSELRIAHGQNLTCQVFNLPILIYKYTEYFATQVSFTVDICQYQNKDMVIEQWYSPSQEMAGTHLKPTNHANG